MKTPKTLKDLLRTAGHPLWKGKAYRSITAYRNVEEFIETVGNLELSEVKTTTLDKWLKGTKMARSLMQPSTVKAGEHQTVLRFAVEREWMSKMPSIRASLRQRDVPAGCQLKKRARCSLCSRLQGEHEVAPVPPGCSLRLVCVGVN